MKEHDYHAEGQYDQEKSWDDSFVDLMFHGGQSPHYNPPSNKKSREEYKAGWKNAKKNR